MYREQRVSIDTVNYEGVRGRAAARGQGLPAVFIHWIPKFASTACLAIEHRIIIRVQIKHSKNCRLMPDKDDPFFTEVAHMDMDIDACACHTKHAIFAGQQGYATLCTTRPTHQNNSNACYEWETGRCKPAEAVICCTASKMDSNAIVKTGSTSQVWRAR